MDLGLQDYMWEGCYRARSCVSWCLPQLPRMPGNPWFLLDWKFFWPFAPSGLCWASGDQLLSTNEASCWLRDHANFLRPFLFKHHLCDANDRFYQDRTILGNYMGQNACILIILVNPGQGLSSTGLVVCLFNFSVSPYHMATLLVSIHLAAEFHWNRIFQIHAIHKHTAYLYVLKLDSCSATWRLVPRSTNPFRTKSATSD